MVDYNNILFCSDFSEDSDIAFNHALDLAKKYSARLHIIHIPHSSHAYLRHVVDEHVPEEVEEGEVFANGTVEAAALEALEKAYGERLAGFDNYEYVVRFGSPDVEIIRYAKKHNIDVIVMGVLGKAEKPRMEHGGTARNVSKYAHCHVIAIRNPAKRFTLPGAMY